MSRREFPLLMRWLSFAIPLFAALSVPVAAADDGGFQAEVKVQKPTRLDWEFVAGGFEPDGGKLPSDYLSYRQRYQLFVPNNYEEKKAWPLVVFLSPGDDPLGWRSWQKVCEARGVFFCAAYGAGNNRPIGERVRIVLDMLDDVRRRFRIDPEQTYFAGLGEGGRLASALAYGLPELCGGVILIGAAPEEPRLAYLRQRTQDRLSVAFVIGDKDDRRREVEEYWNPCYRELAIRAKVWSMKSGHELPPTEVLGEVYSWLSEDLPRRRKDVEARPNLAVKPEEGFDGPSQATRLLEAGQADLVQPGRLYRGLTLLQGIEARWPKSEAAEKARLLVRELQLDQRVKQTLMEQASTDEQRILLAQAKTRDRMGDIAVALPLYEKLAAKHADSDEGKKALEDIKRLKEKLATTPYLGIAFEEDGVTVRAVAPNGPADRAGLRPGDRIAQFGKAKIESLTDLRRALEGLRPGDKIAIELLRDRKTLTVQLEPTATPREKKD